MEITVSVLVEMKFGSDILLKTRLFRNVGAGALGGTSKLPLAGPSLLTAIGCRVDTRRKTVVHIFCMAWRSAQSPG